MKGIGRQQQLHDAVVGRRTGRLNNKYIFAPHVFVELTETSPSLNLPMLAWPSGTPMCLAMALASSGFALPVKTIKLVATTLSYLLSAILLISD